MEFYADFAAFAENYFRFYAKTHFFDERLYKLKQFFFKFVLRNGIGKNFCWRISSIRAFPRRVCYIINRMNANFYIAFFKKRIFLRFQNLHVKLVALKSELLRCNFDGFFFSLSFKFVCHFYTSIKKFQIFGAQQCLNAAID